MTDAEILAALRTDPDTVFLTEDDLRHATDQAVLDARETESDLAAWYDQNQ